MEDIELLDIENNEKDLLDTINFFTSMIDLIINLNLKDNKNLTSLIIGESANNSIISQLMRIVYSSKYENNLNVVNSFTNFVKVCFKKCNKITIASIIRENLLIDEKNEWYNKITKNEIVETASEIFKNVFTYYFTTDCLIDASSVEKTLNSLSDYKLGGVSHYAILNYIDKFHYLLSKNDINDIEIEKEIVNFINFLADKFGFSNKLQEIKRIYEKIDIKCVKSINILSDIFLKILLNVVDNMIRYDFKLIESRKKFKFIKSFLNVIYDIDRCAIETYKNEEKSKDLKIPINLSLIMNLAIDMSLFEIGESNNGIVKLNDNRFKIANIFYIEDENGETDSITYDIIKIFNEKLKYIFEKAFDVDNKNKKLYLNELDTVIFAKIFGINPMFINKFIFYDIRKYILKDILIKYLKSEIDNMIFVHNFISGMLLSIDSFTEIDILNEIYLMINERYGKILGDKLKEMIIFAKKFSLSEYFKLIHGFIKDQFFGISKDSHKKEFFYSDEIYDKLYNYYENIKDYKSLSLNDINYIYEVLKEKVDENNHKLRMIYYTKKEYEKIIENNKGLENF